MRFNKYPSIENTYRQKALDYVYQAGLSGGVWTVNEKIHGSNFSVVFDGTEFRMAKKTALIANDDTFYGCQSVKNELEEKIKLIFAKLNTPENPVTYIKLCGEIYGGSYPHPDVERSKTSMKVQSGIWYRPDNGFYGFDIIVNDDFLDADIAEALFKEFDIFDAESLFKGTFEECLKYSNEFNTTIPDRLGLPRIDNNICEGVVIKPVIPAWYATGSRVIFKNKNDKHSEKKNGNLPKEKMAEVKFSEDAQKLYEELQTYITENRLRNVISHGEVGEITDKSFGKLMGLFVKDAIEEFRKDFAEELDAIEKDECKRMNKRIGQSAADIVRKNFLNIIDGLF